MKQGWSCESYLWIILIGQSDIVKVITFLSLPYELFTQPHSEQVPHLDLSKPSKSGYSGNSSKLGDSCESGMLAILVNLVNMFLFSNLAILGILVNWMIMVSDVGRVFTFSALGRRLNLLHSSQLELFSQPNISQLNNSQPNISQLNVSQPNSSKPNSSQPNSSQPNSSQLNSSQPNSSQPNSSQLNSSQPKSSQPNSSQPNSSHLNSSQPNISQLMVVNQIEVNQKVVN